MASSVTFKPRWYLVYRWRQKEQVAARATLALVVVMLVWLWR